MRLLSFTLTKLHGKVPEGSGLQRVWGKKTLISKKKKKKKDVYSVRDSEGTKQSAKSRGRGERRKRGGRSFVAVGKTYPEG